MSIFTAPDVAAAKQREVEAQRAAAAARADRERAEHESREAQKRDAELHVAVVAQASHRFKALDEAMEAAEEQARRADTFAPAPLRVKARSWLHGGTGPDFIQLVGEDEVAGHLYEVARSSGVMMSWLSENRGGDDLYRRADQLECRAWAACIERIKVLAGER